MFERCLYFNVNSLARKLNARWEQAFAPFNLPPSHGYLLRVVLENPGLTQQKIAEELRLNKSTVTRFISALEKKNYYFAKTPQKIKGSGS
jgi:DNA-binding MarR family transcriptional regulator